MKNIENEKKEYI